MDVWTIKLGYNIWLRQYTSPTWNWDEFGLYSKYGIKDPTIIGGENFTTMVF